jgi:hypothetical protein
LNALVEEEELMLRSVILVTLMMALLTACQISSLTSSFFDTPSGAVLFQDDFSDPSSGWENLTYDQFGTLDYFDGYYRIQVMGEQQMLWAGPGMIFTDVRLEADMIKVIGSTDDIFGLICRATDHDNFYFFIISSDGYYGIGKMIDGLQSMIDTKGMLPSEVISQGMTGNHLRVDCIGEQLEFSINGQLLARVRDFDLTNGDVGLLAGNLDASENVVLFDNFSVINP